MAEKSRDAFRTISEVADWLDVPTHVLRFWESRFSQIKPVKRAGGRRYYRPSDMRVIGGVKVLLHDQGMTIRGVQKLFREEGVKHISTFAPELFDGLDAPRDAEPLDEAALARAARPAPSARITRRATPETVDDGSAAPVFQRNVSSPPPEPELATEFAPTPDAEAEAEAASIESNVEETPAAPIDEDAAEDLPAADSSDGGPSAPTIPPTPDVPATDPEDNAPDFIRPASAAARLKLLAPEKLLAQKDSLVGIADRLRAILNSAP